MFAKAVVRDLVLAVLMMAAGLAVMLNPVEKVSTGAVLDLKAFVPREFDGWQSYEYDMSEYRDEKYQSINQLLVREYYKEDVYALKGGVKAVRLIVEYSSDLRNNFSFHFPEDCHRSTGNEVEFFQPLSVELSQGRIFKAKSLFIKGREHSREVKDKLVAYWLVIGGKRHHETFFIKLDQMAAGLLSGSKSGFLVRLDYEQGIEYSEEGLRSAREALAAFMADLYFAMDAEKRVLLFGS